jgi:ATP-dependent Clp protease adaptor protein ClpS
MPFQQPLHEEAIEVEAEVIESDGYVLIVWNDDFNTFDWVIKTLVEVCKHDPEQAEQCAILIHFKGKCDVKKGSYEELKTMCEAIVERGIGATVESID